MSMTPLLIQVMNLIQSEMKNRRERGVAAPPKLKKVPYVHLSALKKRFYAASTPPEKLKKRKCVEPALTI